MTAQLLQLRGKLHARGLIGAYGSVAPACIKIHGVTRIQGELGLTPSLHWAFVKGSLKAGLKAGPWGYGACWEYSIKAVLYVDRVGLVACSVPLDEIN